MTAGVATAARVAVGVATAPAGTATRIVGRRRRVAGRVAVVLGRKGLAEVANSAARQVYCRSCFVTCVFPAHMYGNGKGAKSRSPSASSETSRQQCRPLSHASGQDRHEVGGFRSV